MRARADFTFILFLFAVPLFAQRDSLAWNRSFSKPCHSWDYSAGARFSFLDFEEMNHALDGAGLPGLESPVRCVALAARTSVSWKNWLVESGFEFSFGNSSQNASANRQAVVFRDYAVRSRLLYDVLKENRLTKIFPYAGFGISYQTLRTNSSGLSNPAETQKRRYTQIPFIFEIGLSAERGITIRNKDVFVGVRGGYAFRFFENEWGFEEASTLDLPHPARSAPFVAVMIRVKSAPPERKFDF